MRDQSNKNKYFFAMSPFKVVYLCTFISISIFLSLLWMVERVFNKQAYAHSVETPCVFSFCCCCFVFLCPKRYLNVNFDNTVDWKTKTGLSSIQWKVTLAQMDRKNKERKWVKNIASQHHVTTSTMGCLLLFQDSGRSTKMLSISCRQVIQPLYLSKSF